MTTLEFAQQLAVLNYLSTIPPVIVCWENHLFRQVEQSSLVKFHQVDLWMLSLGGLPAHCQGIS